MEEIKKIYILFPYIIPMSLILNILGNTIKMTFKIDPKHIVWILLLISILVSFIFFNISFESLFLSFITYSFSISSYDLYKNLSKIRKIK